MRSRELRLVGLSALAAVALLSCDRTEPYGPSPTEHAAGPVLPAQIQFKDTRGHPVYVPPNPRSLDDIESAIREAGGLASVALKAPGSARTTATRYRAAVSATDGARALEAVVRLGAEVLDFFDVVNIAVVRIPAERVRAIQESPFVDWTEPAGPRKLATGLAEWPGGVGPVAPSAVPSAPGAAMAEVIPWNVSQVNAPAAWSRTTGAGAKIMYIGSGIRQHYDNPYITNCGGLAHSCDTQFINGTLMMGNMLARENGDGVIGIAKGLAASGVYVWRVFIDFETYDPWVVYSGFSTAYNLGYKVVLYSFQHEEPDLTEADWISWLWDYVGGITVTPIPHQSHLDYVYPSSVAQVVGVSGVRDDGQFAAYPVSGCYPTNGSGSGPDVDLAGPYWSYTTLTTSQGQQSIVDTRSSWLHFCSTQMSAAHVAGVLALVQAYHPDWPPALIVAAMQATASNHASPNEQVGHGIPNADAALDYVPASVLIHDGFSQWLNGPEMGYVTIYTNGGAAYSNLEDANGVYTEYSVSFEIASMLPVEDEALLQVTVYRNNGPGSTNWTEVAEETYTVDDVGFDLCLNFNATVQQNWDIKVVVTRLGTTTAAEVIFWSEVNDPSGVVFLRVG